ncbi:MAG: PQQ-like beta-propeller repeat protein, partial [Planctomycetes bacterium]|nr:PQQ-like beta-propeller repeat protein [Planctomycetota bacterium]
IHQELVAVPVRGGLVCVGLGPERYAGRRQWEYAIPEWSTVPTGFTERSAAGRHGVCFAPRRDRIILVGWSDGQLWWQRDLPGVTIERLYLSGGPAVRRPAATTCGTAVSAVFRPGVSAGEPPAATDERLVIVCDDQRVWVIDATFGRRLQRVETGVAAPQRVDVVGGTIVVWGLESVVGIDIGTLNQVWQQACAPVVDTVVVEAARAEARGSSDYAYPWVAYRAHGRPEWHLLDARGGQPVSETSLGEFDVVSAIVVDSDRLFVVGLASPPGDEVEQRLVRLTAFDQAASERLWSRDFSTAVEVNATQLAAHPDVIPILLVSGGGVSAGAELPAIQLVSKHDGEPGEPLSIKTDFRPVVEATCEMYMLVTPTRMIVQAGGNLIAYGNSPLHSGP